MRLSSGILARWLVRSVPRPLCGKQIGGSPCVLAPSAAASRSPHDAAFTWEISPWLWVREPISTSRWLQHFLRQVASFRWIIQKCRVSEAKGSGQQAIIPGEQNEIGCPCLGCPSNNLRSPTILRSVSGPLMFESAHMGDPRRPLASPRCYVHRIVVALDLEVGVLHVGILHRCSESVVFVR